MDSKQFDLAAGELCLNFANTLDWHASDHPSEQLHGFSDLLYWGEAAGVISPTQHEQLCQAAESQPQRAAEVYTQAIRLRETIYRIVSSYANCGSVDSADLAQLNEALSSSLSHLQISPTQGGYSWEWSHASDGMEQILWVVARSAAELLTSDRLSRTRVCADDRGCGYLFIDTSRNRSRRWCSMDSCGNRAKARRHYKNQ
jgi:predicted RNA-binding Zn ribbon-like protein